MMMMFLDPKDKISESMDSSSRISPGLTNEGDKTCSNCNTTKTPLWRGGPAGPKSLCNACGIKYNKKRRTLLGLDQERTADKNMKKKKKMANGAATVNKSREKLKLMAVGGGKMLLPRLGKQMINLNEEEQAAILLMALSYGSVFS